MIAHVGSIGDTTSEQAAKNHPGTFATPSIETNLSDFSLKA